MKNHMHAMSFDSFGGPEVFRMVEMEKPVPGDLDVLIAVDAAGVCYHDVLTRSGKLPKRKAGGVLGHEVSGRIVQTGSAIPNNRIGERVTLYQRKYCGQCGYCLSGRHDLCRDSTVVGETGGGGYAEFCCVPAANAVRVPDKVGRVEAALAACPVGTSVRAVLGVAGVGPRDTVLITGATGGLGLHQIQVAKSVGARVIAVSSSPGKKAILESSGADVVVLSPDLKFSRDVWAATEKQGVNAVIENVGTDETLPEAMRCCAQNAAIVLLGNVGAKPVAIDPGLTIGRRLRIMGSGNATYSDLWCALQLMATGSVRPVIETVLPFADVAKAHAMMEDRKAVGRVVLSGW
jgi:D-arabinose 1-dehydrogenase-like Zn-dependent alcohol dehydrogenase